MVVVEDSSVEDNGVYCVKDVLIIYRAVLIDVYYFYILQMLSEFSERTVCVSFFRKTITVIDEILLINFGLVRE